MVGATPRKRITHHADFPSMTPISTIVSAYNLFLNDKSRTGQVIECSADKHLLLPDPPLLNGKVTRRACTVWDPLFKSMHGENSGLEEAIP